MSHQGQEKSRKASSPVDVSLSDCEIRVLEIIIPDTLVSGQVLKTLRDIQSNASECEIIWYRIGM